MVRALSTPLNHTSEVVKIQQLYGANGITDPNPEAAASSTFKRAITSGGGFSRSFAQADYQ